MKISSTWYIAIATAGTIYLANVGHTTAAIICGSLTALATTIALTARILKGRDK